MSNSDPQGEAGDLVAGAIALDKAPLGRLVSLFEDARDASRERRRHIHAALAAHPSRRDAVFIGVTGAPGSGKSTLVGELAGRLIGEDEDLAVAVLAVDPSSPVSGGALLGDRTRVRPPAGQKRLFFRSQASDLEQGGLGRASFPVCRALRHLFDVVFVETVGIGQGEVEIRALADATLIVIPPLSGDQVQFLKAGAMEIPDVIAAHKMDQGEAAEATHRALTSSLDQLRAAAMPVPEVVRTSAETGAGIDELARELRRRAEAERRSFAGKEAHFFARWVRAEFGRDGLRRLAERAASAEAFVAARGDFDEAQRAFAALLAGERRGSLAG